MRSVHVSLITAALFSFTAPACSQNNGTNNGIIDNNGANNGANNGGGDGGGDAGTTDSGANNGGGPDVGDEDTGMDFAVGTPGVLNGTWVVERSDDMSSIATLRLRHVEGMSTVTGTFMMDQGSGQIAGGTFVNDEFACSWTLDIEGDSQQFGLGDCAPTDADTFSCRYTSTLAGAVTDATMKRQP